MKAKKPSSGQWMPLDSACINGSRTPVRKGQPYRWDDPAVKAAPELFVPADMSREEFHKACEAYRNAGIDKAMAGATTMDGMTSSGVKVTVLEPLRAGPGVVRCIRYLAVDLPGPVSSAMHIYRGQLADAGSWFVRKWPDHFEPTIV
jgi:hypothetical protein